jgi:aspartyl-tRNA synthetase
MLRTNLIGELNTSMDGKEVCLAGWVHEVRELSKLTFLLLRDDSGIVQVVAKNGVTDPSTIKKMSLPKESVVRVVGTVKLNKEARVGFEIVPKEIENLNPLSTKIPFEVTGKVPADLDVRLNYRYIDMRRLETLAIFNIQSTVLSSFRETLVKLGFREIRTPSIVAEATEGGAELFPVQYFETKAYLAQSPQLYKQLAIIGGMDRVFTITPVFRAEKSNTTFHLTESTQMDIEMAFADSTDAISILSTVVKTIVHDVLQKNAKDLQTLNVKDLKVPDVKNMTYKEAVDALKADGVSINYGDDISRESEERLYKLYGDAVVVRNYPTILRAFYSMPSPSNKELTESYDFIYKGLEISSGAQRIHKPEMLDEAIRNKGMDPKNFEFYINAFRCGAPPHAGWSIGLERITMKLCGAGNIRESSLFPRDRKRLTP